MECVVLWRVLSYAEKQGAWPGWVSAGTYLFGRSVLEALAPEEQLSIEAIQESMLAIEHAICSVVERAFQEDRTKPLAAEGGS